MQNQKNKKIYVSILIAIAVMVVGSIYVEYVGPDNSHRVFGVTYMTMNNPFYEVINNELLKVVGFYNDQLITLDPALDIDKQNEQIYSLIERKVDGIFVNPIDSEKIQPALEAAQKAHIPVIVIDAPILDSSLCQCTVVSDNYDAGVQCALDMMERMEQANIILLKHSMVKSAKDRIDGFIDTISLYPQYQIINEGECEGQMEIAMPLMQQLLKETPDVDVVMALNDPSALGALAALESQNRNDVIVYGIDGTPDLKRLILQNDMVAGTVAQSPISIGSVAGENMYRILAGEEISKEVIIPVALINKDNISEYDETGWQ